MQLATVLLILGLPCLIISLKVNLYQKERQQQLVKSSSNSEPFSVSVTSVLYGIIEIGTPPQEFSVLFDLKSKITWVPSEDCDPQYWQHNNRFDSEESINFIRSQEEFSRQYPTECIMGRLGEDIFRMDGQPIGQLRFGLARSRIGLPHFTSIIDGSVGLPRQVEDPDLPGDLLHLMLTRALITGELFTLSFTCHTPGEDPRIKAKLEFGTIDLQEYTGSLIFLDLVPTSTWRLEVDSVTFGMRFDIQRSFMADLDMGTRFIYGPEGIIVRVNRALGFGSHTRGVFSKLCDRIPELPQISFFFPEFAIRLDSNSYILRYWKSEQEWCESPLAFIPHGEQTDWTFGTVFMQENFTIFDREIGQIGFAAPHCPEEA